VRWTLAARTGWTLEYIDALPLEDAYQAMSIWSWENKAHGDNRAKSAR